MSNQNQPRTRRQSLAYRAFWTVATLGAFGYLGAMFAQYLAS